MPTSFYGKGALCEARKKDESGNLKAIGGFEHTVRTDTVLLACPVAGGELLVCRASFRQHAAVSKGNPECIALAQVVSYRAETGRVVVGVWGNEPLWSRHRETIVLLILPALGLPRH